MTLSRTRIERLSVSRMIAGSNRFFVRPQTSKARLIWRGWTAVLAAVGLLGAGVCRAAAPDELAKKIEELTGGRTKIVWEGNTHLPGSAKLNNPIHGGTGGVIGYDTADGKSRVLSTSSYWMMPFITPDGSAVIFNMGNPGGGSKGSKIVNWDGSNERWLVQGEYGWAHCAWVDPKTKITWVYVSDAAARGWGVDQCAFTKVFRVRLDKPDVREPIYETNKGGLWLFATPDGKRLWGGMRGSQEQSMLDIASKTLTVVTGGCDPSHSPTQDRFWAFTGTHRHMIMYDWKDGQAANQRTIQVNTMPGVDGRENVWHPRWSTHPQIFTIMGPEHGAAQIYLGRFNKEVTAVDGWVQISNNGQWNGWSHAWVQPAAGGRPAVTPAVAPAVTPAVTPAPAAPGGAAPGDLAKKIEDLTGGHTKIVWEGYTHLPGSSQNGLSAYDSADGKSRVLSTSSGWMIPFITPDGSAVIFNMGEKGFARGGSKIVNWDGSNERWLVQGEYGWAHCAWVDPKTKITWIYVSDAGRNGWMADKCAFTKVFRVRLDKPEVREPVYETGRGGLWLFATPDGKRLWGSLRDSQEQSMLDIAAKTVTAVTGGCDPSHSPTEDRFFAFSGTHRHMIMFDWKDGQAASRRDIQVNTMPGVDGRESVWHPRWSTHPRVFSIMGPEHGAPAQIYLGRFNKEITAVEGWVQITDNKQWNGWSHAWVGTTATVGTGPAPAGVAGSSTNAPSVAQPPAASTNAPPVVRRPAWPADRRELVFALCNGDQIANPPVAFDAAGKLLKDIVLKHTLWRHYGPNHELILSGSPAEASGAAGFVVSRIVKSKAMTLLAGVAPGAFEELRPRRLIAIVDGETPVLSLVQAGNRCSLEITGRWAGEKPIVCPLPVLRERRPFAFAARIENGAVNLCINGQPVGAHIVFWSPVSLAAPRLVFGDAFKQSRAEAPALDAVALYAKIVSDADVALESRRWIKERAGRNAIPRLRLQGKLIRMAPVPDAAKIAPYTQALVVGEYEVTGVRQGEYKEKIVNVAHWGMLNRQPQPIASRKAGESYDLLVEPFERHPQLEPEYLADTDREPGGALYYDLEN